MQIVVAVLGPHRDGKRHSHFTKGLMHPKNGKLRFRKKSNSTTTEFKDTWQKVWREDYAGITSHDWLSAMAEDGVLKESLFILNVPVPEEDEIQRLLGMIELKLEMLRNGASIPEPSQSLCDYPMRCPYIICCHERRQEPSERLGFVAIESLREDSHTPMSPR